MGTNVTLTFVGKGKQTSQEDRNIHGLYNIGLSTFITQIIMGSPLKFVGDSGLSGTAEYNTLV